MRHLRRYTRAKEDLENGCPTTTTPHGRLSSVPPNVAMERALATSAVAEHAAHCSGSLQTRVICKESHWSRRRIKEALYIQHNECINRDTGIGTCDIWTGPRRTTDKDNMRFKNVQGHQLPTQAKNYQTASRAGQSVRSCFESPQKKQRVFFIASAAHGSSRALALSSSRRSSGPVEATVVSALIGTRYVSTLFCAESRTRAMSSNDARSQALLSRSRCRIVCDCSPDTKASRTSSSWYCEADTALKLHSALSTLTRGRSDSTTTHHRLLCAPKNLIFQATPKSPSNVLREVLSQKVKEFWGPNVHSEYTCHLTIECIGPNAKRPLPVNLKTI
ncbi:hypothetical protein M514_25301, partial [Trichuris suis]